MSVALPNASREYDPTNEAQARAALQQAISFLQAQVLALQPKTATASPSGAYLAGAFVRNSTPTTAGGKTLIGWICTTSGNPATFSPCYCTTS